MAINGLLGHSGDRAVMTVSSGAISLHYSGSRSAHLNRQDSGVKREFPGVRKIKMKNKNENGIRYDDNF